jgi:hypothetical protein
MAHYDLTSGNVVLTEHDVAEKIFDRLDEKEFVEVVSDTTETGVTLDIPMTELPDTPGLYLIYHKGDFNQYECMYAGEGNIRYRVYRFEKELADKSREDEGHSAAKKVRRTGFIRHGDPVYVKYITKAERDSVVVDTLCKYLRLKNIDEHIAHIAGAKFNKRVKKA